MLFLGTYTYESFVIKSTILLLKFLGSINVSFDLWEMIFML